MTATLRPWLRPIALVLLAMGLTLTPLSGYPARAQAPNEPPAGAPEQSEGRPFDGYLGTFVLVFLAFFIIAKSARR
jgi:hypothetical protein